MLNNSGGKVVFPEVGTYTLIATLDDGSGTPSVAKRTIQIIYKADLAVNAPATVHIGDAFDVRLSGSGALDVKWGVKLGNQPVELDGNTGLLTGTAGTLTLYETGTYTITATTVDDAGNQHTAFANVSVTNTAPSIDSFTAEATRNVVDGRYYAALNATCSDPDGDAVHRSGMTSTRKMVTTPSGPIPSVCGQSMSGALPLSGSPRRLNSTMTRQ